jgi:hypothetical protein
MPACSVTGEDYDGDMISLGSGNTDCEDKDVPTKKRRIDDTGCSEEEVRRPCKFEKE